ncbi:MAG: hypothetical protein K6A23_02225 [Butyrivibrio sp.]|nr:hypothetical protein [Butyrivibrio sp.]
MRKVNLMGITLRDMFLRESLLQVETFLKNGALNSVIYLNIPLLVRAQKDESIARWIEHADITVFGDKEILRQCGITARNRAEEAENLAFLNALFTTLAYKRYSVYLISDTENGIGKLSADISAVRDDLNIVGQNIYGIDEDVNAGTINEINSIVPRVIIMRATDNLSIELIDNYRSMINAEVIVFLPQDMDIAGRRKTVKEKFIQKIYHRMFKRNANQYTNSKNS